MVSIKMMTDSGADVSAQAAEEFNIDIMTFPITIGDKNYDSGKDFTCQEFYQILQDEPKVPTHAQITPMQFEEKFAEICNQGYSDLIYVSINRLGSSTHDNALMARTTFYEEHPELKDKFHIHIIDSKIYSFGYGYPVIEAAKKAQKGMTVNEILAYLRDWFDCVEIYFAPYSLEFVKKSGRVSCAAAFMGELLGLKPIISFIDGNVQIEEKVRGEKAIIPALLKKAKSRMTPQTPYLLIRGCLGEESDKFRKEAEKALGYKVEGEVEAGPVIAINAGPKIIGIAVKGPKKSQ